MAATVELAGAISVQAMIAVANNPGNASLAPEAIAAKACAITACLLDQAQARGWISDPDADPAASE